VYILNDTDMTKKILLILSILAPFITYYILSLILKFSEKKFPIIKLSIISLVLLIVVLFFFRIDSHISPETNYVPPKMENGKVKPAENN
jgi:uncharacterized membrane protein (UPF0182 family)|tara:strand:- start:121 stop:387 length:267 start_codon:yes stop_codon:yes gene_type:complete